MSRSRRTVIVGAGVAGLATAWSLARRGEREIVVLEREATPCRHSSGLNAAILRSVGQDRSITAMGCRSAERLRRPPAGFTGVELVDACGLLLLADARRETELRRWIDGAGPVESHEIDAPRLKQLAPHFAGAAAVAFLFPEEGRLDISALCDGFRRAPGVELRTRAEVRDLLVEPGPAVAGVRLVDGTEIRARKTVIAAGGWAGALGAAAGSRVRLRPTRRHLVVTAPDERVDPRWPVVWSLGDGFYCRPESGGLLVSACDEEAVEPDACRPDAGVCEVVADKVTRLLPGLADLELARFWCGLRTLTDDGRFVIGPDPDVERLFWVAGLGGHGMVCAFEIGRLAAEWLTGAGTDRELAELLSPGRFAPSSPQDAGRRRVRRTLPPGHRMPA